MSVYDLKPRFQALLRPAVRRLAAAGLTANQVTWAALVLSAAAGALVAVRPDLGWPLLVVPGVLLVRMALNAVDGMLAREHGHASPAGALLNELADVASDAALYLPLAFVAGVRPQVVVALVLVAALTELAGVLGPTIGASRRYDGPMGKSDRALVLGLLFLALGCGAEAGMWTNLVLLAVTLLAAWTVWRRCARALAEVRT